MSSSFPVGGGGGEKILYNDVFYKSMTEARWAYFFDSLGIPFLYEPATYELGLLYRYTVDFWLPTLKVFLEIKNPGTGIKPSLEEMERTYMLARMTRQRTFLFFGDVGLQQHEKSRSALGFIPRSDSDDVDVEAGYWWFRCTRCGVIDITKNASSTGKRCKCTYKDIRGGTLISVNDARINSALRDAAARTFRAAPSKTKTKTKKRKRRET